MAKKIFDLDEMPELEGQQLSNDITETSADIIGQSVVESEPVNGLTSEEQNDPNKIQVTIEDEETPIVILFGAPSSGKTMTLVRLTRYLRESNFNVCPVKTFRPSLDGHYKKMCDGFNDMITNGNAAQSTSQISFMLLKVLQKGHPICQILEAPGEHYFLPKDKLSNRDFPRYINNIKNKNNRKIWLFIIEPDWEDDKDRQNYVERIKQVKKNMKPQDKAIFLFNKIDKTSFVISKGQIAIKDAIKFVENQYKGIFEPFKNENPITRFFVEYNCKFVPFSTGDYNETIDGGIVYEAGPDEYPRNLWKEIINFVRG